MLVHHALLDRSFIIYSLLFIKIVLNFSLLTNTTVRIHTHSSPRPPLKDCFFTSNSKKVGETEICEQRLQMFFRVMNLQTYSLRAVTSVIIVPVSFPS